MRGKDYILAGVCICIISLVVLAFFISTDTEPAPGRAQGISLLGVPAGLVVIVIGVVVSIRERRKR